MNSVNFKEGATEQQLKNLFEYNTMTISFCEIITNGLIVECWFGRDCEEKISQRFFCADIKNLLDEVKNFINLRVPVN